VELLVWPSRRFGSFCSHVTMAVFGLWKEYLNMSVSDTPQSWTVMETIISIIAL